MTTYEHQSAIKPTQFTVVKNCHDHTSLSTISLFKIGLEKGQASRSFLISGEGIFNNYALGSER